MRKCSRFCLTVSLADALVAWTAPASASPFSQIMFHDGFIHATDGCRFARVPFHGRGVGRYHDFSLRRGVVIAAAAAARSLGSSSMMVDVQAGRCNFDVGGCSLSGLLGDPHPFKSRVTVPEMKPDAPPPTSYKLNPEYLASMTSLLNAVGDNDGPYGVAVTAWGADGRSPIVFESLSGVEFFIMPIVWSGKAAASGKKEKK